MILGCRWARPDRTRTHHPAVCSLQYFQRHQAATAAGPLPGGGAQKCRPAGDLTSPLPAFPGSHLGWEERGSRATHTLSPAKLRDCEVD